MIFSLIRGYIFSYSGKCVAYSGTHPLIRGCSCFDAYMQGLACLSGHYLWYLLVHFLGQTPCWPWGGPKRPLNNSLRIGRSTESLCLFGQAFAYSVWFSFIRGEFRLFGETLAYSGGKIPSLNKRHDSNFCLSSSGICCRLFGDYL